jgi:hypothetical protein
MLMDTGEVCQGNLEAKSSWEGEAPSTPGRARGLSYHAALQFSGADLGFLSRRDSTMVARHEVPGITRKMALSQRDD